jgi:spore coat protein U-like protein
MRKWFLGLLSILFICPGKSFAATSTAQLAVQITIVADCEVTANALAFGTIGYPLEAPDDADTSSTLSVICTNGTAYNLGLGQGTNGTSVTNRRMLSGTSDYLSYQIFRDSARTLNWGDTVGVDTVSATGTGSAQTHTLYGRLPVQSQTVGNYTDSVTVTIAY